jgi:hypothetical protein
VGASDAGLGRFESVNAIGPSRRVLGVSSPFQPRLALGGVLCQQRLGGQRLLPKLTHVGVDVLGLLPRPAQYVHVGLERASLGEPQRGEQKGLPPKPSTALPHTHRVLGEIRIGKCPPGGRVLRADVRDVDPPDRGHKLAECRFGRNR